MNSSDFGKEVKRTLKGVEKGQKRNGARRIEVYHGIAVKECSEVAAGYV